jgi:hypothetical protein
MRASAGHLVCRTQARISFAFPSVREAQPGKVAKLDDSCGSAEKAHVSLVGELSRRVRQGLNGAQVPGFRIRRVHAQSSLYLTESVPARGLMAANPGVRRLTLAWPRLAMGRRTSRNARRR